MIKRIFSLFIFGLISFPVMAGDIYRYVDEDGRVHYTDEPPPQYGSQAEQLDLGGVQTYDAARVPQTPEPPTRSDSSAAPLRYEVVEMLRPRPEETIRDPSHTLTVSVRLTPPLRTKQGHSLQYFVDGKPSGGPTTSTSRTLTEVFRGTHSVQVVVLDKSGRQVGQTETRSVFMKPPSVNR